MITNYSEISKYLNLCKEIGERIREAAVEQLAENPHDLITTSQRKKSHCVSCENALFPYLVALGYTLASRPVLDKTQELLDEVNEDVNTSFEHTELKLSEAYSIMQNTLETVQRDCSQLYSENYYTLLHLDELRYVEDREKKARDRAVKKIHKDLGSDYLDKINEHRETLCIVIENWRKL